MCAPLLEAMHEPRQAPELLMSRVATSGVPIFGRLWEAGCLFSTEEKQRSAVDRQMYSLCEMLTDDSSQHALDYSILDQLQARLGTTTRTRLLPLSPFDYAAGSVSFFICWALSQRLLTAAQVVDC